MANFDLDETSFNLDDIGDDDVDVFSEDRVEVPVEVNVDSLPPPPIDEEKKKEFERKRDEILACVPEEIKAKFGGIYFSSFGKFVGPVLIMNPYKVEPGPLRNQWLTMFRNCQKSGRESNMTHLTYWYGEFNDLRSAYSFQKTSQLISYEKGMQQTEKKLRTIKKKRESGKKLSSKEHNFVKGFEEMERDRSKDPTERCGYVESNFYEEYHIFLGQETLETIPEEKPKKEKPKSKPTSKPKTAKAKKSKIKKVKDDIKPAEPPTPDLEKVEPVKEDEKPKAKKKATKKKKADTTIEASRPKKKAKSGEGDNLDLKIPKKPKKVEKEIPIEKDDVQTVPKNQESLVTKVEIVNPPEERRLSAYEEMIALGDVSSHGETDDGSILYDDLSDSADEDYVDKPKSKAAKKKAPRKKATKTTKGPAKTKEPPKKKAQKTKVKVEKSVDKGGKKDVNDVKKLFKKEQRKFEKCETEFLPLLKRWDKAIGDENVNELTKIYKKLLTCMKDFTAPFIVEYGMSDLMKRSKGYNNELRKQVLGKFKEIYNKKKDEAPKEFKPVKESERYVPAELKTKTPLEEAEIPKTTKVTKIKKDSKKEDEVVNTPKASQEVPTKSSSSTSLSRSNSSNKDLALLSTNVPRKSSSNKDLTTLSAGKPRKSNSNKDLASLSSAKSRTSDVKSEPSSQKQNASSAKQERKRFSLGKLMRAGSSTPTPDSASTKVPSSASDSTAPPSKTVAKNQSNPTWIIQVVSNEEYSNDNRIFGLEFLQQAVLYVPGNKTISYDAIARNIESAIHNWSVANSHGSTTKQENDYWNKIHDLAACISGKRQTGTLAKMIGDGKFSTPDELIRLGDDDL
eukprot:CAMPEP_0116125096 /NCGR_PEP_ID=MMETSP0329-20121206/5629_1 /TAXON_ID=697910 /ORGANISM="Pseudo-nitzschia arenysensis, Strain B593" /LENGTH=848 /DNA_ID=CAMNT_0003619115 /DNA_START=184 /DNA_END=2726 /DNA_ORIENTATION=-